MARRGWPIPGWRRSAGAGWPPPGDAAAGWIEHRLRLGVAEGLYEIGSDRILWLEANAAELNGVSFTKGCYVGQENTARMNWRNKVSRRLVVIESAAPPDDPASPFYPNLKLSVVRMRSEAIAGAGEDAGKQGRPIVPEWLAAAISPHLSPPS